MDFPRTASPLYLAALLIWCMVMGSESSSEIMAVMGSESSGEIMVEYPSEQGEIYAACNVVKYSSGTQFDTNVKALLRSLSDRAPYTGFAAFIYGGVSGRLQCRGDLSPADCRACSVEAVKSVRRDCPNAIGARVQLEYCFLRYENYTFLSQLDASFWYGLQNVNSNTDIRFNAEVLGLMAFLSAKATASRIKFALGSTPVSSTVTIYGMGMCWRDMSRADCATCLSKGIQQMLSCCKERVGVQIFMGSCTLRYEIYSFAKHY